MKILFLSCHTVLEFDDLILLNELGYEVFSPGTYWKPESGGDGIRPPLPQLKYKEDWINSFNQIGKRFPEEDGKLHLTKDLVDQFDIIIVMYLPNFIIKNWEVLKGKKVIWRTIGQSISSIETLLKPYRDGLRILRYSPRELTIPGFIGMDGLIRFYKDPEIYKNWTGKKSFVINFTQSMQQRNTACGWKYFQEVTKPFPRKLFGPQNNQLGYGMGKVTYQQQLREYRENRCYFYTGTHPASYTLNYIEAWMTGIPIVALGSKLGNSTDFPNHDLYEVSDLIQNGVNGFVSDDIQTLRNYISRLLKDSDLAQTISEKGRAEAIRHFDKNMIKLAWKDFLEKL